MGTATSDQLSPALPNCHAFQQFGQNTEPASMSVVVVDLVEAVCLWNSRQLFAAARATFHLHPKMTLRAHGQGCRVSMLQTLAAQRFLPVAIWARRRYWADGTTQNRRQWRRLPRRTAQHIGRSMPATRQDRRARVSESSSEGRFLSWALPTRECVRMWQWPARQPASLIPTSYADQRPLSRHLGAWLAYTYRSCLRKSVCLPGTLL